tara:strand:- start:3799 stop:4668 length:870 start_codon:yes stop_codon:yes gene_type:complete
MNIKSAEIILKLNPPYDLKQLKKNFYNCALKEHPDKNNNSEESNKKFIKIKQAYDILLKNLNIKENISENYISIFDDIICKFININDTNKNILLEELIKNCKLISLKAIEKCDKNNSIKILDFIIKYSEIIGLEQESINIIKEIIKKKFQFDELIIINPSIDNLLDSDIYKLEYNDLTYYIPLWHQEIIYDLTNNKSLIVRCEPILEDHMLIDEKNNLHINITISFNKLLDNKYFNILVGKKEFKINISKLKIKKQQKYIFYKQGILCIDTTNFYNNTKSNIILNITIN